MKINLSAALAALLLLGASSAGAGEAVKTNTTTNMVSKVSVSKTNTAMVVNN